MQTITIMTSHSTYLPEAADLEVQEINMSSPAMKAAGPYMNLHCENEAKEFMLCRAEEKDPRKCLAEGKALTACGVRFLQQVKKLCRTQFDAYAKCIDYEGDMRVYDSQYVVNPAHQRQSPCSCRYAKRPWDACVFENFGMSEPPLGYFMKPHVHKTDRPKPPDPYRMRDYAAEAKAVR